MLILLVVAASTAVTSSSDASVSIALSIDDVAKASALVARAVPMEQASEWQGGRIVTSTRLRIERVIAGAEAPSFVRVRTLGGTVGDTGQIVEGEARFAIGSPSILFLAHREGEPGFVVTGRAQGQLLVMRNARGQELVRLPETGALVPRPERIPLAPRSDSPVMRTFDGKDADTVANEAARAWERTHAR